MIQFGIDRFLEQKPGWQNQQIGMVTNHAATTNSLEPSRAVLLANGFHLTKLFSPEHGLDVQGADGHAMKDGTDPLTGLPVTSLYSSKLAPSADDLLDIDIVLYDIPDAGCRFYTYLWTLTHVMEACAREKKKLVVLDRPNPVSGDLLLAEGPILEISQSSFIGRWPMPIRHSCTLGELALYFNAARKINCELEVITCNGWSRSQWQPDWGIDFVPTSPAIRNFESILLYPGLGLLEATNISEGRGTQYSFCAAAAPWIDGNTLARQINNLVPEELAAKPIQFCNEDPLVKYPGEICHGVQFEITSRTSFAPVLFGLLLIRLIKDLYPDHFAWKPYITLVNPTGKQHLDKLLGITGSEKLFGMPMYQFMVSITKLTRVPGWIKEVEPFLLY